MVPYGHIRVTYGHIRVPYGHVWVPYGYVRVPYGHVLTRCARKKLQIKKRTNTIFRLRQNTHFTQVSSSYYKN